MNIKTWIQVSKEGPLGKLIQKQGAAASRTILQDSQVQVDSETLLALGGTTVQDFQKQTCTRWYLPALIATQL